MEKVNIPTIKRTTLTTHEIATYLGVSVDKVYQMVREKAIPHFRIGSRVLFGKDAVEKWINKMIAESVEGNEQ